MNSKKLLKVVKWNSMFIHTNVCAQWVGQFKSLKYIKNNKNHFYYCCFNIL